MGKNEIFGTKNSDCAEGKYLKISFPLVYDRAKQMYARFRVGGGGFSESVEPFFWVFYKFGFRLNPLDMILGWGDLVG